MKEKLLWCVVLIYTYPASRLKCTKNTWMVILVWGTFRRAIRDIVFSLSDSPSVCKSKQECIPVGCVPAARRPYAGVCFRGGVSAWSRGVVSGWVGGTVSAWSGGGWCLLRGGLPGQGEGWWCLVRRGGLVSQHALRQNPPPHAVNRMTNRCKNITLVKIKIKIQMLLQMNLKLSTATPLHAHQTLSFNFF